MLTASVFLPFLLAACAETQDSPNDEKPAEATPPASSQASNSAGVASQGAIRKVGTRKVTYSFVRGVDPQTGRLGAKPLNVSCKIEGDEVSRSFTTPSTLNLPVYQTDGSAAVMKRIEYSCVHEGKTYSQTIETINLTGRTRALSSGVAVSLVCGQPCAQAAQARAMKPKEGDLYGYTNFQFRTN